ncbi:MAG: hypothetical protein PHQ57_04735, partial [Candidatus Omnitrophica bacterium]|nr:hypothetical protein [Candidatus Omnitrophota bacterium]
KIASEGVITRAKVSEVKSETAKILTAAETTIPAKVAEVKSETANILTAAQTTIPAQITETKTAISDVIKSEILNRENAIRSGQAMTIRFRTYTGLSPKLDVYDANNVQRVVKATMKEIGVTGIYEYDVTFSTAWGKGDFTIVCSESTKNVQDAMTVTVGKTDVEQVYNQVSTVVGSTSSIGSLKTVAVNLNSQVSLIETALSKIGKDLTAKVKEAAASAAQLEPVYAQLSSVAKQIKDISGETGLNLEKLYQVSKDKAQDIVYLKNKTQEVKAAIELNQKLVDNIANKPVTQTWYEYK